MKKINLLLGLMVCSGVYGQNTWDGGSVSTITTNGNVGIGASSSTVRTNINTTSNTISSSLSSILNNTYNGTQYILRSTSTLSGSGSKFGFYNALDNSSAGTQAYGIYNAVSSASSYGTYGLMNSIVNSNASGFAYGINNGVTSSGSATSYGEYTSVGGTGNGIRYGNYINMNGSGTGSKYGLYVNVAAGTGVDTRFGIYSVVSGTGAKSAYFQGDVELNQGNMAYTAPNGNRTLFLNNATTGQYSFSITPNATNNQDDWQWGRSFILDRNGEMVKRCDGVGKVFSIRRFDNGDADVFRVYGDGKVYATEVNVMLASAFPDYVFQPTYDLMPLAEVKSYIEQNGHLPNVPAASTVEQNGLELGETTRVLVEKVEELTLYILQLQAEIEALKKATVVAPGK